MKIMWLLVVSFVVGMASCSSPDATPTKNALKINIVNNPTTLDPHLVRDLTSIALTQMLYEGLMRLDADGNPEPALAEQVKISDDGYTYTFTLRNASWSDGTPVTASDFQNAWGTVLSPHFPSDYAYILYIIKNGEAVKKGKLPLSALGIQVLNHKTLAVTLEYPAPYFLQLTSLPVFFPAHRQENYTSRYEAIVNGPFKLATWRDYDIIQVVKNPSYWDAKNVKLESINMVMVDTNTELSMFENKQLDWGGSPLSTLPIDALENLSKAKTSVHAMPALATQILRFNTKTPPLNNVKMRQALSYAINRKNIADHIVKNNQQPALSFVPPELSLQKEPYFKDHDTVLARQLFEEALQEQGITRDPENNSRLIKDGKPLPIRLSYSINDDRSHKVLQAVAEQWREALDIEIGLENMEGRVLYDKIRRGNYQIANGSWVADFSSSLDFLRIFKNENDSTNNTFWHNETYSNLLDKAAKSSDTVKRREYLNQAEAILMDEMPIAPLFYLTFFYMKQPYVQDVHLSSCGHLDFKKTRLK